MLNSVFTIFFFTVFSCALSQESNEILCVKLQSQLVNRNVLLRSDSIMVFSEGGGPTKPLGCMGKWYWKNENIVMISNEDMIEYEVIQLSSLSLIIPINSEQNLISIDELKQILAEDWLRNEIISRERTSENLEILSNIEFDLIVDKVIGLPIFIQIPIDGSKIQTRFIQKKRKFKGCD